MVIFETMKFNHIYKAINEANKQKEIDLSDARPADDICIEFENENNFSSDNNFVVRIYIKDYDGNRSLVAKVFSDAVEEKKQVSFVKNFLDKVISDAAELGNARLVDGDGKKTTSNAVAKEFTSKNSGDYEVKIGKEAVYSISIHCKSIDILDF